MAAEMNIILFINWIEFSLKIDTSILYLIILMVFLLKVDNKNKIAIEKEKHERDVIQSE